MRRCRHALPLVALAWAPLLAVANPAGAGLTLTDPAGDWQRWQARLAVVGSPWPNAGSIAPWTLSGVRLSGERYFNLGRVGDGGGLRAGGGLLLGSPTLAPGTGAARTDEPLSWRNSHLSPTDTGEWSATPYVGLGYSAWWLRQGLGLSADLGLVAQRPSQALRTLTGGSGLENTVRAMQLSPIFQVNLSFAF